MFCWRVQNFLQGCQYPFCRIWCLGFSWPSSDHITAATYWWHLWDTRVHMWEHGCLRAYAVWNFEGGGALLGCLSDMSLIDGTLHLEWGFMTSNQWGCSPLLGTTLKIRIDLCCNGQTWNSSLGKGWRTWSHFCVWYTGTGIIVNTVFENWPQAHYPYW